MFHHSFQSLNEMFSNSFRTNFKNEKETYYEKDEI